MQAKYIDNYMMAWHEVLTLFLEPFRHVESSRNAIWEENKLLEPSPHCPRDYSSCDFAPQDGGLRITFFFLYFDQNDLIFAKSAT